MRRKGNKRYICRDARGRIKESDGVGRSRAGARSSTKSKARRMSAARGNASKP